MVKFPLHPSALNQKATSLGPHSHQQKSRRDSDRVRNFDTMPPYSAIQSAKSVAFQTHLIHAKPIQIPAAHMNKISRAPLGTELLSVRAIPKEINLAFACAVAAAERRKILQSASNLCHGMEKSGARRVFAQSPAASS